MNNSKLKKTFAILISLTMVFTSMGLSVFAEAEQAPEAEQVATELTQAPSNLAAKYSGNVNALNMTFSWTAATYDELQPEQTVKYALRVWAGSSDFSMFTQAVVNVKDLADTKYAMSNVNSTFTADEYSYQVCAYLSDTDQGKIWEDGEVSDKASFGKAAFNITPAVLNSMSCPSDDNIVSMSWTAATGTDAGNSVLVRGATASSMSNYRALAARYTENNYGTYCYAIRTFAKNNSSVYVDSNAKSLKVNRFVTNVRGITWYTTVKSTTTFYKKKTGSKKYGKIPGGVKVRCYEFYPTKFKNDDGKPKRVQVGYNGKKGWILYSKCNNGVDADTSCPYDYTKTTKQNYVNAKKYSSKTKYLVWVSKYTQRVNVFKGSKGHWTLQWTARVTTGKFYRPTKTRQTTLKKHKKRVYKVNAKGIGYYFDYATYFTKGDAFHDKAYYTKSRKAKNHVNSKQPGTLGCIRMYRENAQQIYKLPLKTKVVIN